MRTREEVLQYALSFPNVYEERPFRNQGWQLVRVKGSKKTFLWIYERNGYVNLNVKVDPQWRDFWRSTYASVIAGYHQNKEHWNTIILDGSIPENEIQRMISESYDLITDSPTKRIYEAVKRFQKVMLRLMVKLQSWQEMQRWQEQLEMRFIRIRIRNIFLAFVWSMRKEN